MRECRRGTQEEVATGKKIVLQCQLKKINNLKHTEKWYEQKKENEKSKVLRDMKI